MKIDRAEILKPVKMLEIATGKVHLCNGGTMRLISEMRSNAHGHFQREYLLLEENPRLGAVLSWWLDMEKQGKLRLFRIAESNDPTYDGIPLPITDSSVLTQHQKTSVRCGLLIKGKFHCERCALKHSLVYPNAISIYPINILPYSQHCEVCNLQIFDLWRSKSGGPLNLFNKADRNTITKARVV